MAVGLFWLVSDFGDPIVFVYTKEVTLWSSDISRENTDRTPKETFWVIMYSSSEPKRIESGNSAVSSLPESRIGSMIIAENVSQPVVFIGSFFADAAVVDIPILEVYFTNGQLKKSYIYK
jgi:hypothetical protein